MMWEKIPVAGAPKLASITHFKAFRRAEASSSDCMCMFYLYILELFNEIAQRAALTCPNTHHPLPPLVCEKLPS